MPETVAFFGAGMLGSGFVQALRRRGVEVRVWNRTPARAKALEPYGAAAFESAAEAAHGATRVHICVRDDAAVDAVLEAALPGIAPGTPVVDHTTVLPQAVAPRAQRLAQSEIPFLHAPVFMGPPNAAAATGLMLASGAHETYERVRAPLEAMTGKLWYLGPRPDHAAIFKLMGNAMILAIVGGLSDMFAIAEANGLTRHEAYRLFENYDPSAQIGGRGKRMAARDYEPAWTLDMAHKDAELMLSSGGGAPLSVIAAVEAALRNAKERGLSEKDLAAIAGV